MKIALLCASAVVGTHHAVLAAATSQTMRRHVRGAHPDAAAAEEQFVVPPPADVGPDGFPQLPAVSNLMDTAQSTAKTLSLQAQNLEKRIEDVQKEKAARMAKQKEIFENKLKSQEEENRVLLQKNKEVAHEIDVLRAKNSEVTHHAEQLRDSNAVMRSELTALKSRLQAAVSFVKQSLSSTDDSHDQELSVLDAKVQERLLHTEGTDAGAAPPHHRATAPAAVAPPATKVAEASVADVDDDLDDDDAVASLLAISSKVHQEPAGAPEEAAAVEDPRGLLQTLEKNVKALQKQEKASEVQLKNAFFKDFQVGAKRKSALVAQQKALNATRDSLVALQNKLKTADDHLEATQKALTTRLHELGTFIQKLGHLAMAPAPEVPHLLQSLPATVSGGASRK